MGKQCVIFWLGKEHYGVDIFQVREIIRIPEIVKVPGAPEFVEGVINLRGGVIPVLDLRKRFGMGEAEDAEGRCIVVVELGEQTLGVIVDGVSEVLEIDDAAIEPPSPFVTPMQTGAISGIAKVDERLIILLDLERAFSGKEREQLSTLARVDEMAPIEGDRSEAL
ncbi:MAG: chemotaxis protein CheW [Clostridia bacterium]|nr:chemotaxis protein CheW [Bacillota bacterium]MBO2522088.1 chemotaxis protein CheW [Bacillota bacterium]